MLTAAASFIFLAPEIQSAQNKNFMRFLVGGQYRVKEEYLTVMNFW